MHKSLVFLAALYSSAVVSAFELDIWSNGRAQVQHFRISDNQRECICLSNTQTAYIKGVNGGTIKLFRSTDCTGNYDILGSNTEISGATWVNSASYGKSGISSTGPYECPNWYATS